MDAELEPRRARTGPASPLGGVTSVALAMTAGGDTRQGAFAALVKPTDEYSGFTISGAADLARTTAALGWRGFKRFAPPTRAFNHLIAGFYFRRRMRRGPLPPEHPDALINDFIFERMVVDRWTPLHRACVDKERVKAVAARLAPAVRLAQTRAIVPMAGVRSVEELHARLRPFVGADVFAKPTHASGGATSLRDVRGPADLAELFRVASRDFFESKRETQYRGLPRKVIVEDRVASAEGATLDDFKFHCVGGEPLLCQLDHSRFGAMRRKLLVVPGFAPMCGGDGVALPPGHRMPTPDRLAAMVDAARALSAPFDYVRVDLYDGIDGIYFGELTFTPGSAIGIAPSAPVAHQASATHRTYSRIMMDAIRRGAERAWAPVLA